MGPKRLREEEPAALAAEKPAAEVDEVEDVDEDSQANWMKRLHTAETDFFFANKQTLVRVAQQHAGGMMTMTFRGIQGCYFTGKGWCVVTTAVFENGTEQPHFNVTMDSLAPLGGLDKNFPKKWGAFPKYWRAVGWKDRDFLSESGELICSNFLAYVLLRPNDCSEADVSCIFTAGTPLGTKLNNTIAAWVVTVKGVAPFGTGGRTVRFEFQGNEHQLTQYKTKGYDCKALDGKQALLVGIKQLGDKFVNSSCCQFFTEETFVREAGRALWNKLRDEAVQEPVVVTLGTF